MATSSNTFQSVTLVRGRETRTATTVDQLVKFRHDGFVPTPAEKKAPSEPKKS